MKSMYTAFWSCVKLVVIFGFAAFKKRPIDCAALYTLFRRSFASLMVLSANAMSLAYANSANTSSGFLRLSLFLQSQCTWYINGTTKRIVMAYNKKKWSIGVSLKDASIDKEYISPSGVIKCWGALVNNSDSIPILRRNSICEKNFKQLFFRSTESNAF